MIGVFLFEHAKNTGSQLSITKTPSTLLDELMSAMNARMGGVDIKHRRNRQSVA